MVFSPHFDSKLKKQELMRKGGVFLEFAEFVGLHLRYHSRKNGEYLHR